jgi:Arc/MetJ family transcription regulator
MISALLGPDAERRGGMGSGDAAGLRDPRPPFWLAVRLGEEAPFGTVLSMAEISRSPIGYTRSMTKRLVEIDDDLLERARSIARTGTIKETVNAALQRLVDDERVMRHVERLRGSGALDLARIEEARRPRTAR